MYRKLVIFNSGASVSITHPEPFENISFSENANGVTLSSIASFLFAKEEILVVRDEKNDKYDLITEALFLHGTKM